MQRQPRQQTESEKLCFILNAVDVAALPHDQYLGYTIESNNVHALVAEDIMASSMYVYVRFG